jgi:hypothetical protein
MLTERTVVAPRGINRFGVRTPLLIPSFSSRGFPDVGQLLELLRDDLYGVCLVSAFDVAQKYIRMNLADVADLVVLDSGVYETSPIAIAADRYAPPLTGVGWTRDGYRAMLSALTAETNVLAVSFDHYGPTEQQIVLAQEDFARAPHSATNFLLKPESLNNSLDISAILKYTRALTDFDVIGVTEKELGDSLVARCTALRQFRQGLASIGLNHPIHVFGAVTPGVMTAYFLSGADIFDGLNWLRYDYSQPGLTCISEPTMNDSLQDRPDHERFLDKWQRNLSTLGKLQEAMRRFADSGDLGILKGILPSDEAIDAAIRVAATASQSLHTEGRA